MSTRNGKRDTDHFSEELLESENDRRIENVASKVSTLKHIALDLRSEAKDQLRAVNNSDGLFDNVSSLMGGSFQRIQGMRRTRLMNCKYMWYFALIGIVLILVVYFLVSHVMS